MTAGQNFSGYFLWRIQLRCFFLWIIISFSKATHWNYCFKDPNCINPHSWWCKEETTNSLIQVFNMMQAVQLHNYGGPEQMFIGEVPLPEVKANHVMIKVHATAINRADTLQRQGKYPPPEGETSILGLEASGTISQLGEGVTKWSIGDRVMALLPGGGNAEFVSAHEDHLLPVPSEMSFNEAAAIPEAWLTAYQLLHFVAKVKSGDTVLIHAGASGVGTALVQLTKLAGATAFMTAGSQEKIDLAVGLGARQGFNYKEGNFAEKVLSATSNRGVDIILDCVGSSFWEQNARTIALEGRWVIYGSMGGVNVNGDILGIILRKRLQLIGSTLRARTTEYKSSLISSFRETALPHFSTGNLKTVIAQTLPFSKLPDGHALMDSNVNAGKIVIQLLS